MAERRHTGHRQRLRERFLAGEEGAVSDEALLELLLTYAVPRKDIKPIAQELIRIFGSLSKVLSTSSDELSKLNGMGQASVVLLKAVDLIKSTATNNQTVNELPKKIDERQLKLFKNPPTEKKFTQGTSSFRHKKSIEKTSVSDSVNKIK